MRVRVATAGDLPGLVTMNADVQAHHIAAEPSRYRPPDPDAVAEWFRGVLGAHELLVAERGGELVGYVIFSVVRRDVSTFAAARTFLLVDQLGASVRREGVGRALLAAVHTLAAERGIDGVELDVRAVNDSAVAFYEALGYRPVKLRMRWERGVAG